MRPGGLRHRATLVGALACGLAIAALAAGPGGAPAPRAGLIGWCAAVLLYLVLALRRLLPAAPEQIRLEAERFERGKWSVLAASLAAAVASLVAVAWDLGTVPRPASPGAVALGLTSVGLSWTVVHVLFAVHYAHEHWLAGRGLAFPGEERPDFDEFLYFAFTVGMTFQVSDVTTCTSAMRRLVLLHGLVAFLFNVVILAAAVSVAVGLVT